MTDKEFDLLEELYFVKTYSDLKKSLGEEINISDELHRLIKKGWAKVLDEDDNEIPVTELIFDNNNSVYKFIATKKGLIAHNQV